MASFFFRVEHDLLRSEAFKELGGSAIKVYLVIGLYSDFETGWGYPSIRTIAARAGLSRQTVLSAIAELAKKGILATSKSKGRATAYKIISQGPPAPSAVRSPDKPVQHKAESGPIFLDGAAGSVPFFLEDGLSTGPISSTRVSQNRDIAGREVGPKQESETRDDLNSMPIPGTPFRVTAEGRLLVSVDLQGLLTDQGLPRQLAERLTSRKDPEDVAKVLLNALYLQSQGKLQNGPGYIRAGLEDGYVLLPQVAKRLEGRRRELLERMRLVESKRIRRDEELRGIDEEEEVEQVLRSLRQDQLQDLLEQAIASLPAALTRRNPTLANPFVRNRVVELAIGTAID